MLKPLKLYKTKNEIFLDLDLEEDVMQSLTDIFEDHGPIEYDEDTKHIYLYPRPEPRKSITHREEIHLRGINFVLWTYTAKD